MEENDTNKTVTPQNDSEQSAKRIINAPQNISEKIHYFDETYQTELENEKFYYDKRQFKYKIASQDINFDMRKIVIDWLIEVAEEYKLKQQTLHLTISFVDRFLEKEESIVRSKLQLAGIACMLVASKLEEKYPPEIADFIFICDNIYNKQQIIEMERDVVKLLEYRLITATIPDFMVRYWYVLGIDDQKLIYLSDYLSELALRSSWSYQYLSSKIATACVVLSLYACHKLTYPKELEKYTGYSIMTLFPIITKLANCFTKTAKKSKSSVYERYSVEKYHSVAKIVFPDNLTFN